MKSNKILHVLLLFLFTVLANAQSLPTETSQAIDKIKIDDKLTEMGFEKTDENIITFDYPLSKSPKDFQVQCEIWYAEDFVSSGVGLELSLAYSYVSELSDLPRFWKGYTHTTNRPVSSVIEDADGAYLTPEFWHPSEALFFKGKYLVEISNISELPFDRGVDLSEEQQESLVNELKDELISRIDKTGVGQLDPFEVSYSTSGSNDNFEIQISLTGGLNPGYSYILRKQGQEVDKSAYTTLDGSNTITLFFNNLDEGEYELDFIVSDSLQRIRSYKETFLIENEQGDSSMLLPQKDSTLSGFRPHQNEGANPRLFMGFGKSQSPIVAFDLRNTDLNGLSKATLVLNIQDCDLPRRWGRDGRKIEAVPLSQFWTEGNGYNFDRPRDGRRRWRNNNDGDGPGVTWFSPTDHEISNKRPNGSEKWFGARVGSGPVTAPWVTVTNGQTGTIHFDVTQDIINGYYEGWVLEKEKHRSGNIRFFSKEAGTDLAPQLILEFGETTAGAVGENRKFPTMITGANIFDIKLRPAPFESETKSWRELLRKNAAAALLGEELVSRSAPNPAVGVVARIAFRAWVA